MKKQLEFYKQSFQINLGIKAAKIASFRTRNCFKNFVYKSLASLLNISVPFFTLSWGILAQPAFSSPLATSSSGITYGLCGRFGDNLLSSLHALWLSHSYNIPLIYTPFYYSSELHLSQLALPQSKFLFIKTTFLNQEASFPNNDTHTLFVIPYFPEAFWEAGSQPGGKFSVNWKDLEFRKKARELIAPIHPLSLIIPPQNSINIAIHVREGGGVDSEEGRLTFAPKLPPLSFYINSLKAILKLFEGSLVHCHFFTDALKPQAVVDKIVQSLPYSPLVTFDYRHDNNSPGQNVLEDFFSLFYFDILVRPESNFSIIPSLLHDYIITAYPSKVIIRDGIAQVVEITLLTNEALYQKKVGRSTVLDFSLLKCITQDKTWLDFRVAS